MLRAKKIDLKTLDPWNFLIIGILLTSISPYLSLSCYIIFMFFALCSPEKISNQVHSHHNLSKTTIVLLAFLSIALLSRVSMQWGWGIHSVKDPMLFPVTIVDYLLIIFFLGLTSHITINKNQVKKIVWSLIISVWFEFLFCCFEKFYGIEQLLIAFPNEKFSILKFFLHLNHLDQVTGSLLHPNNLGLYSLICFPIFLAALLYYFNYFITLKGNNRKHPAISWELKINIAILLMTFVIVSLIILWSKSRQAQLLYLSELFICFLFISNRKIKLVTLFLGISLFANIYFASNEMGWLTTISRQFIPSEIWGRFSSIHKQSFRINVFNCAMLSIKSYPWLGLGIGSFAIKCENELGFFINHAHNIILQVISDVGIPLGFIIGYIKFVYWKKSYQNIINQIKFNKHEINPENKKIDVSIFLVIGFFIASINTVILSMVSLSVFQSYRLLFLYGITLLIPYTFSDTKKSPQKNR